MKLEKKGAFGVILDDGNTVRGLWLADQASAVNTMRLRVILALEEAKGRQVDLVDYSQVVSRACPIDPGPADIGGYVIMFPSANREEKVRTR